MTPLRLKMISDELSNQADELYAKVCACIPGDLFSLAEFAFRLYLNQRRNQI